GTAAYMSPEQAKGRAVDKRADIFAFGAVLYEMLSGRRAFQGEDITDTLTAVMRDTPPWTALPAQTPPRLQRLIERCLDRDLKQRLRDIGEARIEIAKIESGAPDASVAGATMATPSRTSARIPWAIALGLAIAEVLGLWAPWTPSPARASSLSGSPRVSITLPDGDEIKPDSFKLNPVAISPDGTRVAYVGLGRGKSQIYVRVLTEAEGTALGGTDGGESPFFSPDGQWIGFFADNKLKKIATGGGALRVVADAKYERGGTWSADGFIYFAPLSTAGIWRVSEAGGTATEVTHPDRAKGEISHRWPHLLPDNKTLLFAVWTGPGNDEHSVVMQSIASGERHVLVGAADFPRYVPEAGVLLYSHAGDLFATSWRPPQTDLGRAVPVLLPEHPNGGAGNEGASDYGISTHGVLAYVPGGLSHNAKRLVWVDRSGNVAPLPLPDRDFENVAISPDGTQAVVQIREGTTNLWIYDFARGALTPFTTPGGSSQAPLWSADGKHIIYRGTRTGSRNLYWKAADGSGEEERLTTKPDVAQAPTSVSPDGHWLVFTENTPTAVGGSGVWALRIDGDRAPRPLLSTEAAEEQAQISPDARWLAYKSHVAARDEVFVMPFPDPGAKHQVSIDGGAEPLWSKDGHELFFQNGSKLMGVNVTLGSSFTASRPHVVHEGHFLKQINTNTPWSLTPDGKRFLRIQQVQPERPTTRIDLVLNWFAALKQLGLGK
ncbi:MAG: protein kinase, partial [Vicinamibacterales bacterium]